MKKEDYGDIKNMLLDEYKQIEADPDKISAFLTGMTWFEDALTEDDTEERLNEFLPLRISNEYLRKQLVDVQVIIAQNEKYKSLYEGMKNKMDNMCCLSNKELSKLRMDMEFQNVRKELSQYRRYRDLYYELLAEKNRKGIS